MTSKPSHLDTHFQHEGLDNSTTFGGDPARSDIVTPRVSNRKGLVFMANLRFFMDGFHPSRTKDSVSMTEPEDSTIETPDDPNFFQAVTLCDLIFSQPFRVFQHNAVCFITIALFASGLRALLAFVFDVVNGPNYGADYGTQADVSGFDYNANYNSYQTADFDDNLAYSTDQQIDWATVTMSFVDAVILYVVCCLADGATVQVVAEMYAGKSIASTSPVVAMGTVAFKAMPLVGSCLVVSLGLTVFFLVLMPMAIIGSYAGIIIMVIIWVIATIYVSLATFLMYPAIVVEHKGILDCIQRSVNMTHEHLGHIFVVLLTFSLLKSTVGVLAVAVTFQYETSGSMAAFYIRGILNFGINTFFIALQSILKSIIYFNIRIIDEQLTQEKLSQEMGFVDEYTHMSEKATEKETSSLEQPQPAPPESEGCANLAEKEMV